MSFVVLVAASSLAFNLVCTGTENRDLLKNSILPVDQRTYLPDVTFRTVLRVDLAQRRWCRDQCSRTEALVSVTRSDIIFEDQRSGEMLFSTVSRETGNYEAEYYKDGVKGFQYGNCRRAEFSGFPRQQF